MAESWAIKLYTSSKWIALRKALIQERGPICQHCRKIVTDTSKLIAHHKHELTPANINDANIALNPDNIQLICHDCHNIEHDRFGRGERHIYLVYGSPCSGKSTLVEQMRNRGDLIVDMDMIYVGISGCELYDKPDNIRTNAFRVRDVLIDNIKTRYGHWNKAFIVGGYPHKQERDELAMKLGAEQIYCNATQEECMARAKERGVFAREWEKYIKKWWNEYD